MLILLPCFQHIWGIIPTFAHSFIVHKFHLTQSCFWKIQKFAVLSVHVVSHMSLKHLCFPPFCTFYCLLPGLNWAWALNHNNGPCPVLNIFLHICIKELFKYNSFHCFLHSPNLLLSVFLHFLQSSQSNFHSFLIALGILRPLNLVFWCSFLLASHIVNQRIQLSRILNCSSWW